MKVNRQIIDHVANLSRLKLDDDEAQRLMSDMEQIIMYVDRLNELDTENVKPKEHVMNVKNVFREDVVNPSMSKENILRNAPEKDEGCFKVPRIVE